MTYKPFLWGDDCGNRGFGLLLPGLDDTVEFFDFRR